MDIFDKYSDDFFRNCAAVSSLIKEKINGKSYEQIAKNMGYHSVKTGIERIKKTIQNPTLCLTESFFDGTFSSSLFLKRLLQTLELYDESVKKMLDDIIDEINDRDFGYRPWIFCETNYILGKPSAPVFAMAMLERKRRLILPKKIKMYDLNELISYIRTFIKEHQKQTGGKIHFWGKINKYVCHIMPNYVIEFSPEGKILNKTNKDVRHPAAKLKLKNRIIF